ncbi:MAG: hypothetical protein AB7P49_17070, partial [Bdellovibrionales bacterium]
LGGVYAEEEMHPSEVRDVRAREIEAQIQKTDTVPEFEAADYFMNPEDSEIPADDIGEYVVKFGNKHKGKKLKEIDSKSLGEYLDWILERQKQTPSRHVDVLTFIEKASEYLSLGVDT